MFYRIKGMNNFECIGHEGLIDYLQKNTSASGKVTAEIELVRSGILLKSEVRDGEQEDTFRWVFSTFDSDRVDERIDQKGWDLEGYALNPVVLWAHNHSIPAIGLALDVDSTTNLSGSVRFNDKAFDEFGWSIGERVKHGVIRAGSVGLRLLEVEFIDHRNNPAETCDVIFRKQELLEFSICNVPANPFALRSDWLGATCEGNRTNDTSRKVSFWPSRIDTEVGGLHGR